LETSAPPADRQQRLRVTYRQDDVFRYVGHLDLVRTWERALRRAGVPLAYSEGFNPQAKLQFASALPLGATSREEIVDVMLTDAVETQAFWEQVTAQLPAGLSLVRIEEAPLKTKALQGLLRTTEWQADVQTSIPPAELSRRVDTLLASETWPSSRQRKGRVRHYDLRPLVLALRYEGPVSGEWQRLAMTLRSEPAATGRPDAVLEALDLGDLSARIERIRQHFASP
jgi:radical SAM-linked protein